MPRYRQEDYIGSGAYGSVYGCCEVDEHDVVLADGLAIKYLKDEWLDDDESRERFRREARFLRQLKHPNILPVIYSNLSADRPYIVTQRAESNLGDALKHNRASNRDWALSVFRAVLTAVAYAHEQHVLHRDLKPDNVLFLGAEPVVSDFGMGKNVAPDASGQTLTNRAIGTPLYMAPEMWTDAAHATKAADVFSLGKMLWELVTNRPPQPWGVELDAVDDVPLRDYIARCCDQEPTLRFRDASEALRAWDTLVGGLAPARSPFETAESLVNEWRGLPQGHDIKALRRLDELLDRQRDEEQLYYDLVPYLPAEMVEQYASVLPDSFAVMVRRYAGHIPGQLPYEYCDAAAEFYALAFDSSEDNALRRFVLTELFELGPGHNRYPVADIVRKLLWSIEDEPTAELVAEVIRETPSTEWYRHWQLFQRPLAEPIKTAFKALAVSVVDEGDDGVLS